MEPIREVFSGVDLDSGASGQSVVARIVWPGGKGWIVVGGLVVTGAASLVVTAEINPPIGGGITWDMPSLTADGIYEFEAPEAHLSFTIDAPTGDDFAVSAVHLLTRAP